MFDLGAITAAIASASDPRKIIDQLDDDELADLQEDTEDPEILAMINEEFKRRSVRGKKGAMTGTIVWIVVIAMLIGSIAAVAFR